jgi:hypothetical protein
LESQARRFAIFAIPYAELLFLIFRIWLDGGVDSGLLQFGPVPLEGRFAIVTDVERDAVDAGSVDKTSDADADGEAVWS